jgi:hypothetical protein
LPIRAKWQPLEELEAQLFLKLYDLPAHTGL